MTHDLRWVNVESRAGIVTGYYAICSCGRFGPLRPTKAAAQAEHANHAT